MIASPSNVQTQLGEAISVIADSDFWRRWDTLTQVRVRPRARKLYTYQAFSGARQPILNHGSQSQCRRSRGRTFHLYPLAASLPNR